MPAGTAMLAPTFAAVFGVATLAPWRVLAPPERSPDRTVVVQGDDDDGGDGLDAQRTADARSPGLATVIDLEHEAGARSSDGLGEVLGRAPAATVRSFGGLGQFASVSIRGSSAQQVQVFYEGVPMGDVSGGLSNLADLPLDGLERVEIYRGFVPATFGGATIGGAVNLAGPGVVDRVRGRGSIGVGSFAARELQASVAAPIREGVSVGARVGYAAAEGAFAFYDTNGTPTFTGDDGPTRRANNDYARLAAQLRFDGASRRWRWSAQQFAWHKDQGVPGPAQAQAQSARLVTTSFRTMGRVSRRSFGGPGGRLDWATSLGFERRSFADPRSELGVGLDDQRTDTLDLYTAPALRLPAWRNAFVSAQSDLRVAALRIDERGPADNDAARSGDSTRRRAQVGLSLSLEQFLNDRRVQLVPVLRFDALVNRFAVPEGEGEFDEQGADTTQLALSPRLGLRAKLVEGLSLRMSGGRYFRPPTLLELFGDRGFARGREDLRAESGLSMDFGFVFDRAFGGPAEGSDEALELANPDAQRWRIYAQAGAFAVFSRDLIAWVQAGPIQRPENFEGARALGTELSAQITTPHRWVVLQANYTFVDTVNFSRASSQNGQPLPGRPRHELFARLSGGPQLRGRGGHTWAPRAFVTADYIAQSFLDPSGRLELPPRSLAGLGAELEIDRRVHLAAELRNLFDRTVVAWRPPIAGESAVPVPMSDFIGYPLPGRSLWLRAAVDF